MIGFIILWKKIQFRKCLFCRSDVGEEKEEEEEEEEWKVEVMVVI